MGKLIDVTGQRYGRLLVIGYSHKHSYGKHAWLCRCDCGKEVTKITDYLRAGKSRSCGCWEIENLKNGTRTTHGQARRGKMTRTYRSWHSMMRRCYTNGSSVWKHYGARGIKVCKRWHKFENFLEDMGDAPDKFTIERIDVNGNYEPSNCKWVPFKFQGRNKRNTKWVTYLGETKCLAQWVEDLGLNYSIVNSRLRSGWAVEDAFKH